MSTIEEKWPEKWPVTPIPTKPFNPPYMDNGFKLHVEPQEFTICGLEVTDPNYKPFVFRIKNPLDVEIEYLVKSSGLINIFENRAGARGILKPSEISEPIEVLNDTFYEPVIDERRGDEVDETMRLWQTSAPKIKITYCYVTPEDVENTKKKWAKEEYEEKEMKRRSYHWGRGKGIHWCLTNESKGYFLPKVTIVPGPLLAMGWMQKPYEQWEEPVDKPKRKCTIF